VRLELYGRLAVEGGDATKRDAIAWMAKAGPSLRSGWQGGGV